MTVLPASQIAASAIAAAATAPLCPEAAQQQPAPPAASSANLAGDRPFLTLLSSHWDTAKFVIPYIMLLAGFLISLYVRQVVVETKLDRAQSDISEIRTDVKALLARPTGPAGK